MDQKPVAPVLIKLISGLFITYKVFSRGRSLNSNRLPLTNCFINTNFFKKKKRRKSHLTSKSR